MSKEEEESQTRAVEEFEKVQMGLEVKVGGRKNGSRELQSVIEDDEVMTKRGEKRKFELDEDELVRIAREDRSKARKAIDEEKVFHSVQNSSPHSIINTKKQLGI